LPRYAAREDLLADIKTASMRLTSTSVSLGSPAEPLFLCESSLRDCTSTQITNVQAATANMLKAIVAI
jgi:hypothetical protein